MHPEPPSRVQGGQARREDDKVPAYGRCDRTRIAAVLKSVDHNIVVEGEERKICPARRPVTCRLEVPTSDVEHALSQPVQLAAAAQLDGTDGGGQVDSAWSRALAIACISAASRLSTDCVTTSITTSWEQAGDLRTTVWPRPHSAVTHHTSRSGSVEFTTSSSKNAPGGWLRAPRFQASRFFYSGMVSRYSIFSLPIRLMSYTDRKPLSGR